MLSSESPMIIIFFSIFFGGGGGSWVFWEGSSLPPLDEPWQISTKSYSCVRANLVKCNIEALNYNSNHHNTVYQYHYTVLLLSCSCQLSSFNHDIVYVCSQLLKINLKHSSVVPLIHKSCRICMQAVVLFGLQLWYKSLCQILADCLSAED